MSPGRFLADCPTIYQNGPSGAKMNCRSSVTPFPRDALEIADIPTITDMSASDRRLQALRATCETYEPYILRIPDINLFWHMEPETHYPLPTPGSGDNHPLFLNTVTGRTALYPHNVCSFSSGVNPPLPSRPPDFGGGTTVRPFQLLPDRLTGYMSGSFAS